MKEWNCYTNADKLLKLRWPTYEPTSFLLVWWFGSDKKHNCHSIISKDYESAEYCALEFITLNKVEHAVLYKSAVKLNKKINIISLDIMFRLLGIMVIGINLQNVKNVLLHQ